MPRYASETTVPVAQSRAEIESLVTKYGASQFFSGWSDNKTVIGFTASNRQVRFVLPLPSKDDHKYQFTEVTNKLRSSEAALKAWEQDCRQRWRALCLVIKAKLEAVECGIATFEEEFLAHIVLPDGKTVGQHVSQPLAAAYASGEMLQLLPGAL